MSAVADMAQTSVSAPNAARAGQIAPEQKSVATDQPSSAQPFTAYLSEQTSNASRGIHDKKDPTGELAASAQERPAPRSKKNVVGDVSTLVMPVVPAVPVVTSGAAPVALVATGPSSVEAAPRVAAAVALAEAVNAGKGDSKPLVPPVAVGASRQSEVAGHSGAMVAKGGATALTLSPAAGGIGVDEKAAHDVHAVVVDHHEASISTAGSMIAARDQGMISVNLQALAGIGLPKAGPEARESQKMSVDPLVQAKSERHRDGSARSRSTLAEPPTASGLADFKPLDLPVSPPLPLATSVPSVIALAADAPVRIDQVMPHSLDVGELAGAISRPLNEGLGGYTLLIAMRPADLGQLQAVVTMQGNDLQVSITPQTHVGHQALANSVDSLKEKLSHGGVNVNVTLHDAGSQSRRDDRPASAAGRSEVFLTEESVTTPSLVHALPASQIHLIL